jgi:peptidoglycan/LPS O-acetylase OafA/YrhL
VHGLDALRGIAILLVLLRHHPLNEWTQKIGWIGVDLFFVISGFLVSGLLFDEFQKNGRVNVLRFLLRRLLKIYPLYLIVIGIYLICLPGSFTCRGLMIDLVMLQNYLYGWGNVFAASWSLAIELHFYLFIGMLFGLANLINTRKNMPFNYGYRSSIIPIAIIFLLICCLMLRLQHFFNQHSVGVTLITMSHLRLDSLFAGVLVSWVFRFKKKLLYDFVIKHQMTLAFIAIVLVSWTPFIEILNSDFGKTIGFSLLYIAFSILLLLTIVKPKNPISHMQPKSFQVILKTLGKIGLASYAIYLIHGLTNILYEGVKTTADIDPGPYWGFLITSTTSIVAGWVLTNFIEAKILLFRDRKIPAGN